MEERKIKIESDRLIITRIFNTSREKLWTAWTDPEEVKKWWGPKDFTAPFVKINLTVGGKYLFCMRGSEGPGKEIKDYWSTGSYLQIEPMQKLVVTDNFSDKDGNVVPPEFYGMSSEGWAKELTIKLIFEEVEKGKMIMTLVHIGFNKKSAEMAAEGWNQSFDKLAASLQQER